VVPWDSVKHRFHCNFYSFCMLYVAGNWFVSYANKTELSSESSRIYCREFGKI
jgi:hypothetical protein